MSLFGPPDIEKLKRKRKVRALGKALAHESREIRLKAARALAEVADERAVEPLLAALEAPVRSPGMDLAICRALARIGDPRAADPVASLLPAVYAAETLAELGARRALPPLERALKHSESDAESRSLALALQRLNWKPSGGGLSAKYYLFLQDEPEEASWKALEALGKPAVNLIIDWVKSRRREKGPPAAESIVRAMRALGSIGVLDGLAFVVRSLGEPAFLSSDWNGEEEEAHEADSRVRTAALEVLAGVEPEVLKRTRIAGELTDILTNSGLSEEERVVFRTLFGRIGFPPPLMNLLHHRDLEKRVLVAEVLKELEWDPPEDDDELRFAFWAARGRWDKLVEIGADAVTVLIEWLAVDGERRPGPFEALLEVGEPAIGPLLSAIEEASNQVYVAEALVELGEPSGSDALFEIARSESKHWRYAADLLVEMGDGRGADALAEVAGSDSTKKLEAARALALLGDSRAFEPLGTMAREGSIEAIESLGETRDRNAAVFLAGALAYRPPGEAPDFEDNPWGRDAHERRETVVRTAAAEALARLGDPRGFKWLQSSLLEGRGGAVDALVKVGSREAVETLKSAAEELNPRRFTYLSPKSAEDLMEWGTRLRERIQRALGAMEHPPTDSSG